MDMLHEKGVYFILWLQKLLQAEGERMVSITRVGDPEYLIYYLFPLISAVNSNLFVRVVLTTALCDTLNNIFKWILHGERPYWWVHENADAHPDLLDLKQFSVSCETGPGSPSGHAMITAAVWYILLWYYVTKVLSHSRKRKLLTFLACTLYFTLNLLVAVSRLYIATHFPHQVLLGATTGLAIGWCFTQVPIEKLRFDHCFKALVFTIVFAMTTYFTLTLFGVDPSWSVKLSLKWCANRDWVHLNTSPLSALFRNSGALIGLGLSRFYDGGIVNILHKDGREIVTAAVAMIAVHMCAWLPLPPQPVFIYYGAIFMRSAIISIVAVVLVPFIVKDVLDLKEFPQRKFSMAKPMNHRNRKITANF